MTSQEAREALSLYRPGSAEGDGPQVAEALAQVQRDPELREWFERTGQFHRTLREKFREIPVPTGLKEKILSNNKIVRVPWWRQPSWLAAAAAVVALLLGWVFLGQQPQAKDRFSDYRSRMIRFALRNYAMDIMTNNLAPVRSHLQQHGTPSDFPLPKALEKLAVTGGGSLDWRGNPVSMVCFDRGDKQMVFLFVMDRSGVKDAPRSPERVKVNKLVTECWSQDDKTYLLAGPEGSAVLSRP